MLKKLSFGLLASAMLFAADTGGGAATTRPAKPERPENDLITHLRRALQEIHDWLTPAEAAPVLARHFGKNDPSQIEAAGLIEAIDKLHQRADEIVTAEKDAEAAAAAEATKTDPAEGGAPVPAVRYWTDATANTKWTTSDGVDISTPGGITELTADAYAASTATVVPAPVVNPPTAQNDQHNDANKQ